LTREVTKILKFRVSQKNFFNTPTERGCRDEKNDTGIVKNRGREGGAWTTRAQDGGESGAHTQIKKPRVRARATAVGVGFDGDGLGIERQL
jgi:hypothetical protein